MTRLFLLAASLSGALAVGLGAFAAHGLKSRLSTEQLQTFDTGVRYQFYHTLALLAVAWLSTRTQHPALPVSGYAFMVGILLFSGSLYLLATRSLLGLEGWTWLGPVTPLGGLAFIAGWLLLFVAVWSTHFSTG